MKLITQKITFLLFVACLSVTSLSNAQTEITFDEIETFYKHAEVLNNDNIRWGYLNVPENWDDQNGTVVRIAVAVLKNFENKENAPATVFIQGGPGASGIGNIFSWQNHPLRKNHDIVLFDIRGTGNSQPRLCPDLGRELLGILAKDQPKEADEEQKTNAALACKQEMVRHGVDIEAYHSGSVAKDLHALLNHLKYKKWNIYAASYGTYMAQVYASMFPQDIEALVLDSSIADIETYYTENTSNYMTSLAKVFTACENDPECNEQYPNLEKVYYEVISDMEKSPITVDVAKNLVEEGTFTFNSEDFKIAIQQALYNKQLVEVVPLLIYQFKEKNEGALGNLVAAFSSLLSMDYGVYYCVSCNEALPNNEETEFEANAANYPKLNGGLSFYKSDFKVCDVWNRNIPDSLLIQHDLSNLKETAFPVLVFSGEYDPITPATNGQKTAARFSNANAIPAYTYGHIPGFTRIGTSLTTSFINNPAQSIEKEAFAKAQKIKMVKNVALNGGVGNMGNSLNEMNILFLAPLLIAVGIMLAFIFVYLFRLFKKKYQHTSDKIIRIMTIVTSIVGLLSFLGLINALLSVSKSNFFILAFGLPENYNYLFQLTLVFLVLVIITVLFFGVQIKKIHDRSIVFSVIFSNILIVTYMLYWGIFAL
ncbi:TAP-like protein [Kordia periserrulae]|uniref:TAP-like protein n=1 Tax=Kordia periserrulae TaxID=701523 RepID=A0A2T6BZ91_9FLAO|nr:alpha/beta fold hydrolase [Kordia periserrulae]PTX61383.1 TAP-like protein [Kordia periserrulae]